MPSALVDSYLKAQKHTHPETDGWKDKMDHSNKRLRAERNIYISAGCMFAFVVMCQLWALVKRCLLCAWLSASELLSSSSSSSSSSLSLAHAV